MTLNTLVFAGQTLARSITDLALAVEFALHRDHETHVAINL
jgi:hypothetical protein